MARSISRSLPFSCRAIASRSASIQIKAAAIVIAAAFFSQPGHQAILRFRSHSASVFAHWRKSLAAFELIVRRKASSKIRQTGPVMSFIYGVDRVPPH